MIDEYVCKMNIDLDFLFVGCYDIVIFQDGINVYCFVEDFKKVIKIVIYCDSLIMQFVLGGGFIVRIILWSQISVLVLRSYLGIVLDLWMN